MEELLNDAIRYWKVNFDGIFLNVIIGSANTIHKYKLVGKISKIIFYFVKLEDDGHVM